MTVWHATLGKRLVVVVSTGEHEPEKVRTLRLAGYSVRKLDPEPQAPRDEPIIIINEPS